MVKTMEFDKKEICEWVLLASPHPVIRDFFFFFPLNGIVERAFPIRATRNTPLFGARSSNAFY